MLYFLLKSTNTMFINSFYTKSKNGKNVVESPMIPYFSFMENFLRKNRITSNAMVIKSMIKPMFSCKKKTDQAETNEESASMAKTVSSVIFTPKLVANETKPAILSASYSYIE